ncbi:sensor domain-containing diguanylate cyclase [Paenibacillus sp. sgz302251]|uniref:sensor domain-containing diguanylate cyclase n=1 Tax=Paenibacillus sp. sgz302251 TaxID=3414493 RepID=UPI003C7E9C2E
MNKETQTLVEASDYVLNVMRNFIGTNTLFIAKNDGVHNHILKVFNRSEVLLTEGTAPFAETYCSLVLNKDVPAPLFIDNTATNTMTSDLKVTQQLGPCSFIGIPITSKENKSYGTICALDPKPYNFSEKELGLLEAMATFLSYVAELENAVLMDHLTNTYNRNYLTKLFSSWEEENKEHLGLLFIDIDDFKSVNDRHGHEIGDLILKEVAHRLKKQVCQKAAVTRLGGDEFILLIPDYKDTNEVERLAEELIYIMKEPIRVRETCIEVSLSIGIAYYSQGMDLNGLLSRADKAMYFVKNNGKSQFYAEV